MNARQHRIAWLIIPIAAFLAFAPAAMAKGQPPNTIILHRTGTAVNIDPHGTQARYNAQVSTLTGASAAPSLSPDRSDKLGGVGGPRVVQVTAAPAASSQTFDWADAAVGAGIALLVMVTAGAAATLLRGRGGIALPS